MCDRHTLLMEDTTLADHEQHLYSAGMSTDDLPNDLRDLHSICNEISRVDTGLKSLRIKREKQLRYVVSRHVYTQSAIQQAMGVSRTLLTHLLRRIKDEETS